MKTPDKIQPEPAAAVPITILTGFLGSGKTTLLNYILTTEHGLRAGVLVNDFGAINIDAKLVVGVEGETVSLANGCVCCTMREDLITEVVRLLSRPDAPEYIIVEASGVSDPKLIVQSFLASDLEAMACVDSVVAVVDSEQLTELRGEDLSLALNQITTADLVVLNKADLVTRAQLDAVRARVSELVPGVRLLPAVHAKVPLVLLLGVGRFGADRLVENETNLAHHHQSGRSDGDCDRPNHGHSYATWHWTSLCPLSISRFRSVIDSLPASVFRAKGLIQLREYPQYTVEFQLAGRRSSLSANGLWGETIPRSEIVMIGTSSDAEFAAIQERLDSCTQDTGDDQSWVDWRTFPKLKLTTER